MFWHLWNFLILSCHLICLIFVILRVEFHIYDSTVHLHNFGNDNIVHNLDIFWSQAACVQNVLDSLVPALLKDENRKFIYVEQVRKFASAIFFSFVASTRI